LARTILALAVVVLGAGGIWAAARSGSGALFPGDQNSSRLPEARAKPEVTSPDIQVHHASVAAPVTDSMPLRLESTERASKEQVAEKPNLLSRTAPERAPAPQTRAPFKSEVETYLRRARDLVALGDISAARLMISRAAEGKDSRALVALAETYDPVVLRRWKVVGMRPDPEKARALYEEALQLGSKTAGEHLLAMK
jgi:hypothetical protein